MTLEKPMDRPLLPLRKGVVLPGRVTTLPIGRDRSLALARELEAGDEVVIAVQHDPDVEMPALADVHPLGVLVTVKDRVDRGKRGFFLVVEGIERVRIETFSAQSPFIRASVSPAQDIGDDTEEAVALARAVSDRLGELGVEKGLRLRLDGASPGQVADHVASWVDAPMERKLEALHELDAAARLRLVAVMLSEAKARAELKTKVDSEVRQELGKAQQEHLLRQQLRAIQKQLGDLDGDGEEDPLEALAEKLEARDLPEEARKQVDRELKRLRTLPAQAPDANVIRTYLELVADLPWDDRSDAITDLDAVAAKLDEDHYGLDEVKRRVLEHMAVLKLAPEARGTVLCLLGPPGVGKTSLAQSVADATNRPLVRVSLGGVRDEAEIRGHRRTYVGAMPGKILSALRKAGVKNPVIVLDEVDKVSSGGWAGDPQAALLELLDPEQNERFTDHYVDLPFDLSEVLFIATANDLSNVSLPLRDRLEILEVSGYTQAEKVQIGRRHLFAEQLRRHGLGADAATLDDATLELVVSEYTRESGVRRLKQQLAKLLRSVALDVARGNGEHSVEIDEAFVRRVLGKPRFLADAADRERPPGVAAGLAWTPVGGDVLYVETTRMPGKGRLEITGQLGDVMSESAKAALAYVRTHAGDLGIDPSFLERYDLHVHVPAGGVPKDGPSAGVTMFTAFASLLSGRAVRPDIAMTGEATLRGRVLPVGGIKEKVLAAHRAGFERVALPRRNGVDLEDIPQAVRDQMEFILVDRMSEVLDAALEPIAARESVPPHAGLGNTDSYGDAANPAA